MKSLAHHASASLVALLVILCARQFSFADDPATSAPATQPAKLHIEIRVDTSQAPQLKEFGHQVGQVAGHWYPIICEALPSDGFTPPRQVNIVFKPDLKGVAYTSGATVSCNAEWFEKHPEDIGAIVHELVHVVQQYPNPKPTWLVEGIADDIRFGMYEPGHPMHLSVSRMKYTDGYQPAAAFLMWTASHYDKDLVKQLNADLRQDHYSDQRFKQYTGKSLDLLWDEFKADVQHARDAARKSAG